jgi:integrase
MLENLEGELLRNQVMLLIAYDGALRREELVRLEINDFDFAYRQIRVQAEHAKNRRERIVGYGKTTSRLLEVYLRQRKMLSAKRGPLFLSESHRNASHPLALVTWSKIVQKLAERAGLSRFTTHTPRHLRLTHMARVI